MVLTKEDTPRMADHDVEKAATTEGLPVSVSMGPALAQANVPVESSLVNKRVVLICGLSILLAIAAALIAQILMHLIWGITNLAFFGHLSFHRTTPPSHIDVWWRVPVILLVPVLGGVIVGFMARYGSKAI